MRACGPPLTAAPAGPQERGRRARSGRRLVVLLRLPLPRIRYIIDSRSSGGGGGAHKTDADRRPAGGGGRLVVWGSSAQGCWVGGAQAKRHKSGWDGVWIERGRASTSITRRAAAPPRPPSPPPRPPPPRPPPPSTRAAGCAASPRRRRRARGARAARSGRPPARTAPWRPFSRGPRPPRGARRARPRTAARTPFFIGFWIRVSWWRLLVGWCVWVSLSCWGFILLLRRCSRAPPLAVPAPRPSPKSGP